MNNAVPLSVLQNVLAMFAIVACAIIRFKCNSSSVGSSGGNGSSTTTNDKRYYAQQTIRKFIALERHR
jgi:hypothetical protein